MSSQTLLIDTHCHLDYLQDKSGDLPADVMTRAKADANVSFVINPAVNPANWQRVIDLAEAHQNVYAALAIHPTDVSDIIGQPDWVDTLKPLLKNPKVVAIGETGLDYYWDTAHMALQQDCLRAFLNLGVEYNLPVILHDRDFKEPNPNQSTHQDIASIVDEVPGCRGVMHCFSGDTDFALQMIDKGFYISFAGNVTFKNAHNLHQAAKEVPLDKMLIETDTPFLAPMPYRGKTNEPGYVKYVAQKIAELKNIAYEEVAHTTTQNATHVFKIPG